MKMTTDEAISELDRLRRLCSGENSTRKTALILAIDAIEKLDQIRAIMPVRQWEPKDQLLGVIVNVLSADTIRRTPNDL